MTIWSFIFMILNMIRMSPIWFTGCHRLDAWASDSAAASRCAYQPRGLSLHRLCPY